MRFEEAMEKLENEASPDKEVIETALDAMAFVASLHQLFRDTGMTETEEPSVDEMEHLVDALYGELGAAVLFLSEKAFARAPDLLRSIGTSIEVTDKDKVTPTTIVKGFSRLATRIENTRVNKQAMAAVVEDAKNT